MKLNIKFRKHNFLKSEFTQNILTMISGVFLGQVIIMLSTPIISRIFLPETIGEYDLIISSGAIIIVILGLGLMTAIMIPKEDDESNAICYILKYSCMFIGLIIFVLLCLISPWFTLFSVKNGYILKLFFMFLYIFSYMLSQIYYAAANRKGLYRALFLNSLTYSIFNVLFSCLLGFLGFGVYGYISGTILGNIARMIQIRFSVNPFAKKYDLNYMKEVFTKYRHFTKYQMPANLLNSITVQVPLQLIAFYFGGTALGHFSMANKIINLPNTFIATPVNRVYYQTATKMYNNNQDVGTFSFKMIQKNIQLAIIPVILLMLFGEELFSFFLGSNWHTAGIFASTLVLSSLMQFCGSCLSNNYMIIRKPQLNLYLSLLSLVLNISIIVTCGIIGLPIEKMLFIYSLGICLKVSIDLGYFLYLTKFPIKKFLVFDCIFIFVPLLLYLILHA